MIQEYGARPLRRAITALIEDPLADAILNNVLQKGSTAILDWSAEIQQVTIKIPFTSRRPQLSSNIVSFKRSPSASKLDAVQ